MNANRMVELLFMLLIIVIVGYIILRVVERI
jgi:hypothetical protein